MYGEESNSLWFINKKVVDILEEIIHIIQHLIQNVSLFHRAAYNKHNKLTKHYSELCLLEWGQYRLNVFVRNN